MQLQLISCMMETENKKNGVICQSQLEDVNGNDNKAIDKCTQWLECCNLTDNDDNSSYAESVSTSSTEDNSCQDNVIVLKNENVCFGDEIIAQNNENITWDNLVDKSPNQYKNIQIYKSQNVHIGDVTHINGPVYINQFAPTVKQNIVINTNQENFSIVSRRTWLAQPPLDPDDVKLFPQPTKFVIIGHTASEEAYTQTDNNLLVRLIQQFHIESRKWNDIGYNFLIGADGSVYEGRGWKVMGAHTFGYNSISMSISFIGCYMRQLPPPVAIKKAQALIKHGVKIGAIAEDYSLLGHCQCRSSESPGRRLFEEIKTWDRWDESVSIHNPSPLSRQ